MISGSLFGDSGEALGDQGSGPGSPKMACRWHPRGLLRTPWWPKDGKGNQGRISEEKKHFFKAIGKTRMWLKHSR